LNPYFVVVLSVVDNVFRRVIALYRVTAHTGEHDGKQSEQLQQESKFRFSKRIMIRVAIKFIFDLGNWVKLILGMYQKTIRF
jgi:hypothetical protein